MDIKEGNTINCFIFENILLWNNFMWQINEVWCVRWNSESKCEATE